MAAEGETEGETEMKLPCTSPPDWRYMRMGRRCSKSSRRCGVRRRGIRWPWPISFKAVGSRPSFPPPPPPLPRHPRPLSPPPPHHRPLGSYQPPRGGARARG